MENKKQLLLIVIAVIVGIVATVMTSSYVTGTIQRQTQELQESYETKQKEVISSLQQQSEQKMNALAQEIQRAKTEQAEATQRQIADLQAKIQEQQRQQQAAVPVKKIKPSLAVKTPTGKRAVTVMIDSLNAVGGLLNPGDFVDIIAQLKIPVLDDKAKNTVTAMVFQGLEVLAVNTNLEETGAYYDEQQNTPSLKVTIAVDPQEAGLLSFADKNGKLEMALRSPQDSEHQMVKSSTWKALADYVLQNQGADIEIPPELKGDFKEEEDSPIKPSIQIFRGGKEL